MSARRFGLLATHFHRARHRAAAGLLVAPLHPHPTSVAGADPQPHVAEPRGHRGLATLAATLILVVGFGGWRLARDEPGAHDPGTATAADRAAAPRAEPANDDAPAEVRSRVRIGARGELQTTERVTFTAPQSSLTVSVTPRSASDGRFDPRIDDLRLTVEGQPLQRLTGVLSEGDTVTFKLPARATSAVLDYSVTGAVLESRPSAPGRALALVTPLSIKPSAGLTSRIEIVGKGVLNIGCSSANRITTTTTCGTHTGHGWVVDRRHDGDVIAQVDLPTR